MFPIPGTFILRDTVARHSAARQIFGKPCNSQVEVPGETAHRVCPWNSSGDDPVLRACDTVGWGFDLYEDSREVQTARDLVILSLPVVSGEISLSAERTFILMSGIRTSLDPKVGYTVRIVVEAVGFYNCVLDIEQFPA